MKLEAVNKTDSLDIVYNARDIEDNDVEASPRASAQSVEDVNHSDESVAEESKKGKTRTSTARPINAADLSVEDKIIIRMKRDRHSDKEIADHLREEGHVNYVAKTIGTRWARLRKKIADHRDQQLDKGEARWTSHEDIHLVNAVTRAKAAVAKLVAEAEAKIWHITVKELHDADRTFIYSTRACRERYEAMTEGRLSWYPELADSDLFQVAKDAKETLAAAREELQQGENEVAEELLSVIALHEDDEHTPLPSPKQSVTNTDVDDATLGSSLPEDEEPLSDLDAELNGLPTWMTKTARQEKAIKEAFARLENEKLPPVQVMKRKELVAELAARGFQSAGTVDQLRSIVRRARKGDKTMPKAVAPPTDIATFKKILHEKKVWEMDASDNEEDSDSQDKDEGKGKGKGKKTGNVKVIPKNTKKTAKQKSLKRKIEDSEHEEEGEEEEDEEEGGLVAAASASSATKQTSAGPSKKKARVQKATKKNTPAVEDKEADSDSENLPNVDNDSD